MQPPYSDPSPPPYSAPPPKKGVPVWAWVLIGCVGAAVIPVLVLAAILFPVFLQAREKARQVACASNMKQMSLGMLMYAEDYDQRLPPSRRWMDATAPYVKIESVYRCPVVRAARPDDYGYACDSRLSGKATTKIAAPERTMMLYDSTNLRRNAADPGTSLPKSPPRHRRGNNIAHADGSVRFTLTNATE